MSAISTRKKKTTNATTTGRSSLLWLPLLMVLSAATLTRAFLPAAIHSRKTNSRSHWNNRRLHYKNDANDNHDDVPSPPSSSPPSSSSSIPATALERLNIAGVSICAGPTPTAGFYVLLQSITTATTTASQHQEDDDDDDANNSHTKTIPLPMTHDPQDAYASTSPESLTIIQLLSGVDMAGAILPPETLAKLVVLSCEQRASTRWSFEEEKDQEDRTQRQILKQVHDQLLQHQGNTTKNTEATSASSKPLLYADAHPWLQSRVTLPQVTLDELILEYIGEEEEEEEENDGIPAAAVASASQWQITLNCYVKGMGSIQLVPTPDLIQAVTYQFDAATSPLFVAVALALRYKAPTLYSVASNVVPSHTREETGNHDDEDAPSNTTIPTGSNIPFATPTQLQEWFPQRTTVAKLQQSSTRVTQNIERGFEIHKLTKALEIARRLGDVKAERKIREKLDAFDSFQELPTTMDQASTTSTGNDKDDESSSSLIMEDEGANVNDETSFQ